MIYATPVPLLQEIIDPPHFDELQVADLMGLIPDPWMQTGTIAAAILNANSVSGKPIMPEDCIPQIRKPKTAEDMEESGRRMARGGQ